MKVRCLRRCSLLPHKREPEKRQRFRRAGPTRKGLLAPFNPKEDGLHTKKLAASLNAFLCSAIRRPLSRCGGSSPQGSGSALSVTFGDTLSPFCRCATSSPDRGKSFKGRGKKHSQYALGTLSKKRQETLPPRSWLSLRESWREAPERVRSPAGFSFSQIKNNISAEDAQSETEGILNRIFSPSYY